MKEGYKAINIYVGNNSVMGMKRECKLYSLYLKLKNSPFLNFFDKN